MLLLVACIDHARHWQRGVAIVAGIVCMACCPADRCPPKATGAGVLWPVDPCCPWVTGAPVRRGTGLPPVHTRQKGISARRRMAWVALPPRHVPQWLLRPFGQPQPEPQSQLRLIGRTHLTKNVAARKVI